MKKLFLYIFLFLFISTSAYAEQKYQGKVIDLYDGDTMTVVFDLGFNLVLTEKVRLMNYDSPELRTKDLEEKRRGYETKEYVKNLVLGRTFDMTYYKKDKYGRLLIDLFLPNGESLSEHLVNNGMGRFYDGGHKEDWIFE